MEAKSIDSLLIQSMQDRVSSGNEGSSQPDVEVSSPNEQQHNDNESTNESTLSSEDPPNIEANSDSEPQAEYGEKQDKAHEEVHNDNNSLEKNNKSNNDKNNSESTIDEYGNPVSSKGRLYTEEEVNQRIRERLSRGKYAEEQQQQQQPRHQQYNQQQVKQAQSEGFEHNPNSEESWEDQLAQFIDNRLEQRQRAIEEQQWKQQEISKHQEFTDKFTSGMGKYHDFHQVVQGKPITDTMMLATREMDNPAAFIYGASKLHPQELERISRIADPYAQAAAVGRLHERMLKERKAVTQSPKPLSSPKGDMPGRVQANQPSLEKRIADYAKQKRR